MVYRLTGAAWKKLTESEQDTWKMLAAQYHANMRAAQYDTLPEDDDDMEDEDGDEMEDEDEDEMEDEVESDGVEKDEAETIDDDIEYEVRTIEDDDPFRSYSCPHCTMIFEDEKPRSAHIKLCQKKPQPGTTFLCPFDGKSSDSVDDVKEHIAMCSARAALKVPQKAPS
jgi:hypothetical protein